MIPKRKKSPTTSSEAGGPTCRPPEPDRTATESGRRYKSRLRVKRRRLAPWGTCPWGLNGWMVMDAAIEIQRTVSDGRFDVMCYVFYVCYYYVIWDSDVYYVDRHTELTDHAIRPTLMNLVMISVSVY